MLLSLPEVAERLGVDESRVRQRIAAGSLRAEKIGGRWLLDEADLVGVNERRSGRPLSPDSAWALIGAAAARAARAHGANAPDAALLDRVAPVVRSRSRARLKDVLEQVQVEPSAAAAEEGAEEWAAGAASSLRVLLRNRAARAVYSASPRDLDDLRADGRLQLSGLSLPESGIAAGGAVEAYVRVDDLDSLADDYLLVAAKEPSANVFLHVVSLDDPQLWQAVSDAVSSALVLATDLAEHRRPREEAQAADLVHRLANLGPA